MISLEITDFLALMAAAYGSPARFHLFYSGGVMVTS